VRAVVTSSHLYTTAAATVPVNTLIKEDGCAVNAACTPTDEDADEEFEEAIDEMV